MTDQRSHYSSKRLRSSAIRFKEQPLKLIESEQEEDRPHAFELRLCSPFLGRPFERSTDGGHGRFRISSEQRLERLSGSEIAGAQLIAQRLRGEQGFDQRADWLRPRYGKRRPPQIHFADASWTHQAWHQSGAQEGRFPRAASADNQQKGGAPRAG